VIVALIADGSGNSYVDYVSSSPNTPDAVVFQRNGSNIASQAAPFTGQSNIHVQVPGSSYQFMDLPTAGTYTYTAGFSLSGVSTDTVAINATKLLVYEL